MVTIQSKAKLLTSYLLLAAASAVFLMLLQTPASAEVLHKITYEYYDVEIPANWRLDEAMFAATPLHSEKPGSHTLGRASYQIAYDVKFEPESMDTCRLAHLSIEAPCHIILPRLKGSDQAAHKEFAGFLNFVKKHELTHCKIALEHAQKLESRLKKYKPDSYANITKKMDKDLEQILQECESAQNRFDADEYRAGPRIANISQEKINKRRAEQQILKKTKPGAQELKTINHSQQMEEVYRDADGVWRSKALSENPEKTEKRIPTPVNNDRQVTESPAGGFYRDKDGTWRNY